MKPKEKTIDCGTARWYLPFSMEKFILRITLEKNGKTFAF
jgi:hypothetical protein